MPARYHASRLTLTALALLALLGHAVPAISQEAPRAAGPPPYRVGDGVSRPEILSQTTKPVYTELARRARVTGTVIVEAIIDENGDVKDVRVLKGLPMGLSQAAVDAVKTWRFKPATREGRPVPVYYVLTVNFQVDDSPSGDGPMFVKFLKQNPDFAALLRGKRYREAEELLDGWATERPEDPAIPLARIQLLLNQGQLQEAWRKALDDHGPERYESLCSVGAFAWRKASDMSRDSVKRAEEIELGLQAETAAMEARVDGSEAILYKSWLLRSKAELTPDPAEHQALIEEADRLGKRAAELERARSSEKPEPRQDRQ
jgi:TonB family protein